MQDEATQIPQSLNRIMVFGLPGSGKSTFSTCLAKSLNVPIYHLDKYFFVENWKVREKSVFLKIQQDFVDQSQWVIDGNAMGSLEMRFQKADAAIYFRYPRFVCMWRLLRRRFQNWHLDDLAQGCTKNFGLDSSNTCSRFAQSSMPTSMLCEGNILMSIFLFSHQIEMSLTF